MCNYTTLLNLDHDFFDVKLYSLLQKSPVSTSVVIIANFCRLTFKRIIPDEYYLFLSKGYALAAVWSIAMAADYVTNVNLGFEQFATAVGIYAAKNPL